MISGSSQCAPVTLSLSVCALWCGVVWCGVVWCGVVWCGVVWCAGAKEFVSMMPMVCVDAVAMLFLFDLTNPSTLLSVREWYRQVRGLNKVRCSPLVFLHLVTPWRWRG